jgi:hypothetical protein
MNSTALHGRHRYVQSLRDYADWLETDTTIPAPNDLFTGALLPDADEVAKFARVHQLGEPDLDGHGNVYADKHLGAVTHRVYAKAAP